jgi:N-acetylglucosaminyldiphosphoundecaprenol N-acetyl-beta-D-mannosaminyltransferase
MIADRANVLGCQLDRVDMQEAVERCRELIDSRQVAQHVSVNAAKLVALRSDTRMQEIVSRCELVTADGTPVVWASRLLGDPLPMRVAGIDLMSNLLELAEEHGYGVYVLGARQETLERAIGRIQERHPRLNVSGYHHGYFADEESYRIREEIRTANPDILFVAMSSPRKEYWLAQYGRSLGVPFLMGVGGSIDIWAGEITRAPAWMQRFGLEWLHRLSQEPGRLWKRYLLSNATFTAMVLRALARAKLGGSSRA